MAFVSNFMHYIRTICDPTVHMNKYIFCVVIAKDVLNRSQNSHTKISICNFPNHYTQHIVLAMTLVTPSYTVR